MVGHDTSRTWYHTIDLPDGRTTNGWFDTRRAPQHTQWPSETLDGLRCLDVGTFDGFWAFEMERRGAAEVVALDVDDPASLDWFYDERESGPEAVRAWGSKRGPGFTRAAELVGSRVTRLDCSVYDLSRDTAGAFDLVFCGALLEHLSDPVRALERMRRVCRGCMVVVEHLDPHLELLAPRVPAGRFNPEWDQWWRVNSAGLVRMVHKAGFTIDAAGPRFLVPFGPAAPKQNPRQALLHSLAARRPGSSGILFRSVRASPRSPQPSR